MISPTFFTIWPLFLVASSVFLIFGEIFLVFSSNNGNQRQRTKSLGDAPSHLAMSTDACGCASANQQPYQPKAGTNERRVCTVSIEQRKTTALPKNVCTAPVQSNGTRTDTHFAGKVGIPKKAKPRWASSPLLATGKFFATETLLAEGNGRITKDSRRATRGRTRPQKGVKGGTPPFIFKIADFQQSKRHQSAKQIHQTQPIEKDFNMQKTDQTQATDNTRQHHLPQTPDEYEQYLSRKFSQILNSPQYAFYDGFLEDYYRVPKESDEFPGWILPMRNDVAAVIDRGKDGDKKSLAASAAGVPSRSEGAALPSVMPVTTPVIIPFISPTALPSILPYPPFPLHTSRGVTKHGESETEIMTICPAPSDQLARRLILGGYDGGAEAG